MATGGVVSTTEQYRELQDKLEELTTCPICRERFKQPKILACHHTFCCQCLQSYFEQTPENHAPCPLCRCSFSPPSGEVSNLPTSTFMQDVVMMIDRNRPMQKKDCIVCNKGTENADFMCVECDLQMCEPCVKIHGMFQTHSHSVLRLDEARDTPIIAVIAGKKSDRMCEDHTGQILDHICLSCNVPMCSECKSTSHSQHIVQNIFHAAEETRNIIRLIQKDGNLEVECLTKTTTEIKSRATSLQISTDAMKDEVRTETDLLVNILREKERAFLLEIDTDAMRHQKELKSIQDVAELRLIIQKSFLDHVKSLETFGNVTQLSVAKATIRKRSDEFKEQRVPLLPAFCEYNRKFKPSETIQRMLNWESLGSVATMEPDVGRKPPPIPPRACRTPSRFHAQSRDALITNSQSNQNADSITSPPPDPRLPLEIITTPLVKSASKKEYSQMASMNETSPKVLMGDNEYTNPKEFLWKTIDNDACAVGPTSQIDTVRRNGRPTRNAELRLSPELQLPRVPELQLLHSPEPHLRREPHSHASTVSLPDSAYLNVISETTTQRLQRTMSDPNLLDDSTRDKRPLPDPTITSGHMSFNTKVKISGLAITRKDDIIVVSNNSKKCLVFDFSGQLKYEIADRVVSPWDAAVAVIDADHKDIVYITDTGDKSGEGNVKEYRLDGTYVRTLVNKLRKPHGITTSSCGDVIYVCDAEDSSVIVLSQRGRKVRKIKQNMFGVNLFICPWYVSVATDGEIIVSDYNAGKLIGVSEVSGRKRNSYKPHKSVNALDFRPAMSCVDSESNIYVVDQISNSIYIWAANKGPMKVSIPIHLAINKPVAMAIDSSGDLWVGSRKGTLVKVHFGL